MKKVFIDCGANDGCSIDLFRKHYPNAEEYEIHSFEPNPMFEEKLKNKNVNYHKLAVSTDTGTHTFYHDPMFMTKENYKDSVPEDKKYEYYHFGGTLIEEKAARRKIKFQEIVVEGIDFSKWILDNFNKNDHIVLKMDIEGAEFPVLDKMFEDGSIDYIDVIYIEFHDLKITGNSELSDKHLNKLKTKNITIFEGVSTWDTTRDVLVYDKGSAVKRNLVFLTALKSTDPFLVNRHDDYEWMEYSKKTWKYWCEQHGHDFYVFEEPLEKDLVAHRPNWQRWFKILDILKEKKYDQILSVDASIMVKWDAPNFFEISEHKFCALKSRENMRWTYDSAKGYKSLFNNYDFDVKKYFNSGLIILNQTHLSMLIDFKDFYYNNYKDITDYQTIIVKRGTDQPVLNYFVQIDGTELKLLDIKYGVNHLFRWQVLNGNWQLKEDSTPFFIKYFYTWIFSGFSDRGKTRNELMKQTWDIVKQYYGEK